MVFIIMKTIMLACAGGMSTSLLVTKMQKSAAKRGDEYNILAVGVDAVPDQFKKYRPQVILLGPQVNYMLETVRQAVPVPVEVIDRKEYGMMDGEKVLEQALSLI